MAAQASERRGAGRSAHQVESAHSRRDGAVAEFGPAVPGSAERQGVGQADRRGLAVSGPWAFAAAEALAASSGAAELSAIREQRQPAVVAAVAQDARSATPALRQRAAAQATLARVLRAQPLLELRALPLEEPTVERSTAGAARLAEPEASPHLPEAADADRTALAPGERAALPEQGESGRRSAWRRSVAISALRHPQGADEVGSAGSPDERPPIRARAQSWGPKRVLQRQRAAVRRRQAASLRQPGPALRPAAPAWAQPARAHRLHHARNGGGGGGRHLLQENSNASSCR